MSSPSSLESDGVFHRSQSTPQAAPPPRSPPCQRTPLKINTTSPAISAISSPSVALSSIALSPGNSRRHDDPVLSPDPLIDITRLRVRSKTHHCLYPGASFQGTQKSGRNSYDVNVTIVDVDFNTSFLCGYLRIRGLTDDWPELTTYFDAEIIGSRYGFLTQGWGATEGEDMMHWQRFPAFRQVKNDLKQPYLTMDNSRDRGAVFMRWKERFLVPDHRVHDINGASFAGFYYVCVDFNPQQTQTPTLRPVTQQIHSRQTDYDPTPVSMPSYSPAFPKPDTPSRGRRNSSAPQMNRSSPSASRTSAPVATMGGFYYHQNSEPYQQLSLCHVPERTSSTFEFR
ncbi:hypothetical protein PLICRDRAFT_110570 [Plicaturopsis crispa FD-325 SS-3]|nr:hypothetical protein PLICRDRAFT_110570 [Plicaturopsis crispa FD-325 SS-3]